MHLIERYALSCGVKIDKPFILEKYFPMDIGAYITLHTTSKPAKTYDYWQEVVDILSPILSQNKIQIVQIGGPGEVQLRGCYYAAGQTNINQVAYVIRNGMLHFGADSFPVHIAAHYDKKLVALYSNSRPENVGPYWGNKKNQILLESKRYYQKPSYSLDERPKTINLIQPETIANAVFSLLEIDFNFPYETVFFGPHYNMRMVEGVPNQVVDPKQLGIDALIVRMDFEFNEQVLSQQLNIGKCSIVTNQPVDEKLIEHYRQNIHEVIYYITKSHNPRFVEALQKFGIKYTLITELPENELNDIKIDYFDFSPIHRKEQIDTTALKLVDPNKLFYRSNKFTLSNQQIFPSKMALMNGQPIASFLNNFSSVSNQGVVNNIDELWREGEHLYFLKQKD